MNDTLADIGKLRDMGWTWTRIAAHYKTSERGVRRWVNGEHSGIPDLPPPTELNHYKMLVVSDTQFPHIDRALWDTTLQIADDAGVEEVVFDGDMWDFEQLGRYNHNAYRANQADQEVREGRAVMVDPLDEIPTIRRKRFASGNHEDRYNAYVDHNASAIGDFPSLQTFLGLDDWDFSEYGKAWGVWPTEDLLIAHGWRANKYTAANTVTDLGGSINAIIGHTHRVGTFYHETPRGLVRCFEIGHMCDTTNLPKSVKGWQNWSQMAGVIVTVARDGSYFDVDMNPVLGPDKDVVISSTNDTEYRISR